jgi:serine/threonine protein kinase
LSRTAKVMQRHTFTALNSTFVVDAEYQFVKELGQGAYGCVVAAKHRRTGEGCAIKKITNINTKVCARRATRPPLVGGDGDGLAIDEPSRF